MSDGDRRSSQTEIDIKNLRFYADMAREFKWATDIIGCGVITKTLNEIADRIEALERDVFALTEETIQQGQRLLEAAGKMPHVSVVMGDVRVLGIQGPNQFDMTTMNASLVQHIRDLQIELIGARMGNYAPLTDQRDWEIVVPTADLIALAKRLGRDYIDRISIARLEAIAPPDRKTRRE